MVVFWRSFALITSRASGRNISTGEGTTKNKTEKYDH